MRFIKVLKSREGAPLDLEKLDTAVEAICRKYRLLLLYVFGSYARGNAGKLSDVDIAVLPEAEFGLWETLRLIGELEDVFEDESVDLVDLRTAPLWLIHRVLKEGKCLCARDLWTKVEHEMKWENLYLDTEFLRLEQFKSLERRLQDGTFGH